MARKRPPSSSRAPKAPPSLELEARVDELAKVLEHIELQLTRFTELDAGLQLAHERVSDCSVRARDAETATKLLTERVDRLTLAVAHGIEHVERTENRIKATVGRARRELAEVGVEHPGLEAEAQQLQLIDARSGEVERVHAVSAAVDPAPPPDPAEALLMKLRSFGLSR